MKRKSSALKVQYDIRPSKQTERRLLIDILKRGGEAGLDLSEYSYLGFGGFKFYDFEMLFRHLGIRQMTSVEADTSLFARCQFNKPFDFIEIRKGTLTEYLDRAVFKKPLVAWLDYDSSISAEVIDDVTRIGSMAPAGTFIFVTLDARIPKGLANLPPKQKLAGLREELQGFALDISASHLQPEQFPDYAERVAWAALSAVLGARRDGSFVPLLRVFYEDTTLMLTVGGCICSREVAEKFRRRMRADFPFLLPKSGRPVYRIPPFNFTSRERHLLDVLATSARVDVEVAKQLRRIGIDRSTIGDYKRLVRFLPKYFESYL